jgi:hypothetical protein
MCGKEGADGVLGLDEQDTREVAAIPIKRIARRRMVIDGMVVSVEGQRESQFKSRAQTNMRATRIQLSASAPPRVPV